MISSLIEGSICWRDIHVPWMYYMSPGVSSYFFICATQRLSCEVQLVELRALPSGKMLLGRRDPFMCLRLLV